LTKIKKSIVLKAKYFEWKANTVDFKRKKIQLKNGNKIFHVGKIHSGQKSGQNTKSYFSNKK